MILNVTHIEGNIEQVSRLIETFCDFKINLAPSIGETNNVRQKSVEIYNFDCSIKGKSILKAISYTCKQSFMLTKLQNSIQFLALFLAL